MKPRSYFSVSIVTGMSFFTMMAHAGLVVNGTRFVLPAPATSRSITLDNTGASDILVQSKVENDRGKDTTGSATDRNMPQTPGVENNVPSFIVTPPLFFLAAGKSNQIRLTCLDCDKLPADRESLYRLSISAIPAGKAPPNSVQVAIRSNFKLFYRPAELKGNSSLAYQRLEWRRQGKKVMVSNPTPYYVTLFKMKINNQSLTNPGMVPPFSTRTQLWCPEDGACTIHWRTLDDFGAEKPSWTISPTDIAHIGQVQK